MGKSIPKTLMSVLSSSPCLEPFVTPKDLKCEVEFLCYTNQLLDMYTSFARQAAQAMQMTASPVTVFKYDLRRWSVLRSPHVHKKAMDQFEIRTHKRTMQLFNADSETVNRWLHYVTMNLPAGVGFHYKKYDQEPFLVSKKTQEKRSAFDA
jgi:small subunit ribosomal protein S10